MDIRLDFSESTFGRENNLSVLISSNKIKVDFISPKTKEFLLFGQGEIHWNQITNIRLSEKDTVPYSFIIQFDGIKNQKFIIKGNSSLSPKVQKSNRPTFKSSNWDDQILDVPDKQESILKNSFQKEKLFLKDIYNQISQETKPFLIDNFFNKYIELLDQGKVVKSGIIVIKKQGAYLLKPAFIGSKKVFIEWSDINMQYSNNSIRFTCKANPNIQLLTSNNSFFSKNLLPKLIDWCNENN